MQTLKLAVLLAWLQYALAATVAHNFTIGWVHANPDGAFVRPTIGINGKWPIPRIDVNVGDRLVIEVYNDLGNQSTSLHFHGLFMNGSTHMDGPSQVSQCAIPPGSSFTYNFTVSPSLTWESSMLTFPGRSTGHVLVPFAHPEPVP